MNTAVIYVGLKEINSCLAEQYSPKDDGSIIYEPLDDFIFLCIVFFVSHYTCSFVLHIQYIIANALRIMTVLLYILLMSMRYPLLFHFIYLILLLDPSQIMHARHGDSLSLKR